ncbi:MAG: amino acid permease [Chlamydiae bacterium]|nr:amino acid permease [Chlamydiota bacterium]
MLSVFILAMLNVSIMASLRNLPIVASYGLSAVVFFFLVAIFFLIPCALISAELATGWTMGGGIYIWVKEAFGDRWGFFAIWMQWAHNLSWYPVILSFVAGTIAYIINPALVENKTFVLSIVLSSFWGMTFINYFGIRTSSIVSTIGVILGTIIPGIFVIGLGISWLTEKQPVQTPLSFEALFPDLSKIGNLSFLAGLFLAFSGLEVSAVHAKEVKDPQKNYPRAIILAAIITFFVFMLGALAIAIVIPEKEISLVAGLMEAFKIFFSYYHLEWILPIMGILLVIGAAAEVNAWIGGPIRGLHATSLHGDLPPLFQRVNKHGMPTSLLLFQAIVVTLCSFVILELPTLSAAFWILSVLSAQSYLFMYILLFLAGIKLRYEKPHVPRAYRIPYKLPGIWIVGSLGVFACLFAIFLGFFPPTQLEVGNIIFYESFLIGGLVFMVAVPLIFHFFRKPHWIKIPPSISNWTDQDKS